MDEKKIIRTYKNWNVSKTASICKVKPEEVKRVLKKHGIEIRMPGWKWRSES